MVTCLREDQCSALGCFSPPCPQPFLCKPSLYAYHVLAPCWRRGTGPFLLAVLSSQLLLASGRQTHGGNLPSWLPRTSWSVLNVTWGCPFCRCSLELPGKLCSLSGFRNSDIDKVPFQIQWLWQKQKAFFQFCFHSFLCIFDSILLPVSPLL